MAIEWKKDLETGFDRIDDQHKVLIKKLGEFRQASEEGGGRDALVGMLVFIDHYVKAHFALEETLMLSRGYPDLEAHRSAHDQLRSEFEKLLGVLAEDGIEPALVIRTNVFLEDWWYGHIRKADKRMVKFILKDRKAKGEN